MLHESKQNGLLLYLYIVILDKLMEWALESDVTAISAHLRERIDALSSHFIRACCCCACVCVCVSVCVCLCVGVHSILNVENNEHFYSCSVCKQTLNATDGFKTKYILNKKLNLFCYFENKQPRFVVFEVKRLRKFVCCDMWNNENNFIC